MSLKYEDLEYTRRSWQAIDLTNHHGDYDIANRMKLAIRDLESLDLDLEADATYDLLEDGLTKTEYDKRLAVAEIRQSLALYHISVAPPSPNKVEYWNANMQRVQGLEFLLKDHKETLEGHDAPEGLGTLERRQIALLRTAYADGTLQAEIRETAARAALDQFYIAVAYRQMLLDEPLACQNNFFPMEEGTRYAQNALDMIAKAGDAHNPQDQVSVKIGGLAGREQTVVKANFSIYSLEMLKKFFLLEELKVKFRSAREFQEKGVFAVDQSGSGHGSMVLPMQDILHKLTNSGFNINESTFAAIGTDMRTFRDAYHRERDATKISHSHLQKPEMNI